MNHPAANCGELYSQKLILERNDSHERLDDWY